MALSLHSTSVHSTSVHPASAGPDVVAPWQSALSPGEHSLILYGLVVAALALLAMLVRTWVIRGEIGPRYRPAVAASLAVLSVAFLSYILLVVQFDAGYARVGDQYVPRPEAILAWSTRYMDWSVTVPLLVVELMAVSTLRGRSYRNGRALGVVAAFLMILTGFIGGIVVDEGTNLRALIGWGVVSSVFFAVVYAVILVTVLRSIPGLPSAARPTYRAAMVLLMGTWFVYPVVFGLQGLTSGGGWATTGQLLVCAADVAAKAGFGLLIQRVAKLRTAFDVRAGLDHHPETLWSDGARLADPMDGSPLDLDFSDRPVGAPARDRAATT